MLGRLLRRMLPDQGTDAGHGAALDSGLRLRCRGALYDLDEGPGLDTRIDQRVQHLAASAAPEETTTRAGVAFAIFQVACAVAQAHAPTRTQEFVRLDRAAGLGRLRGNVEVQIGI